MSQPFVLRPLQPEQLPQVVKLEQSCFSVPWSEVLLAESLADPDAVMLAALSPEGELLGYSGLHNILGEGYVDNIAVFPQYRGKGIGLALTRGLLEYAASASLSFVSLEVRAGNIPAIRLYEKLGFTLQGRRKQYYRHPTEDALIMTVYPERYPAGER